MRKHATHQDKCLPLPDALLSVPSLNTSFIWSTYRNWFSRHILHPSKRACRLSFACYHKAKE